jgi:hypothetical protein
MDNSNVLINLLTNDCTGSSSQTSFSFKLTLEYIADAHNQEYPKLTTLADSTLILLFSEMLNFKK